MDRLHRYLSLAAAAGALLLAGCNSSSPAPAPEPPPPPVAFDLPDGSLGLAPTDGAPLEIAAGATARRGNVEFMCAAGGEACVVNIMSAAGDDTTRTAAYEATGGKVAARAAREDITAPDNHGVTDTVKVSAGAVATSGNANIACPAGGMGCTVVVEDGAVKYLATGGAPVLTAARADVTAPANHGVTGTVKVSAGAAMRSGNVDISCPAGRAGCTLVVEDGAVKYLTTGGAPVLAAALERMTVMDGHGLDTSDSNPIRVAAGQTLTRGNVVISCPAGGAECVVHAINAAGGGGVSYEATGGAPTVAANGMNLWLPANHGLTAVGTRTIPAGGNPLRLGNVNISCPAGGRDCTVDIASDGGSATYRATGGAPTAAAAWDEFSDPPAGHGLASMEIAAGATHYDPRGVSLMCPAGAACSVAVADDGAVTYKATGGTPTVMTNEMILAANSGPDRAMNSDGGHAVGLVTRMGTQAEADGWPIRWVEGGNNSIQQGTIRPSVTTSAAYPANAKPGHPTLGVTLGREAFGEFAQSLDETIAIDDPIDPEMAMTHDLGSGWNGSVTKKAVDGGTVVYAAVYSDITSAKPDVEETIDQQSKLLDLSLPFDTGEDVPEGEQGPLERRSIGNLGPDDAGSGEDLVSTFKVPLEGGGEATITIRISWDSPIATGRANGIPVKKGDFVVHSGTTVAEDGLLVCVSGGRNGANCEAVSVRGGAERSLRGIWRLEYKATTRTTTPGETDAQYLTLGAWMSLPEIADGRFDVGVFANGNVPVARDTLQALTGTAKYVGPATGIYARGVYGQAADTGQGRSGRPAVEGAQVGSFSATAELTANFGGANDLPTMNGFVNRFMENGSSLGDWTVQLDRTDGDDHRSDDAARYEMYGEASGEADGRRLDGEWAAEFFESTVGAEDTNPHPGYVAGTFGASTQDEDTPQDLNALHILGAFGAERQ